MRTKSLLPLFLISVMASSAMLWGQNTYVPDDNFEQALIDLGYDDTLDDYVLTANISGVTSLNVDNQWIFDLTGIEDFTALTELICYYNQLTSLDVSNNTALNNLNFTGNQLTSIDVSNNTALTDLACNDNQLTSLDVSNNTALINLYSHYNQLISLDVSNNTSLQKFFCHSNNLIHLNMKNGVTWQLANDGGYWPNFNATNNSLTCIEVNEEDVDWATENWTNANNNIDEGVGFSVVCAPDGYTYVPDDNFEQALVDLGYDSAVDDFVLTANISSVTELYVNNMNISNLTGIEDFTALETLDCQENQLTSLDVSANTALTFLLLSVNELTNLDVSNNTALYQLSCGWNNLTSLELSNNTYLQVLGCQANQLTSLDVSTNTALTNLECGGNQLIHLNMKNGVTDQLTTFYATNNDLTCIETLDPAWATENWTYANGNIDEDVTFSVVCAPEGYTYVPDDNFEQALIDLGYDDVLNDFVLTENISGVTSLDVGEKEISNLTGIEDFTALTSLVCSYNDLTSLDVSNNTALTSLYCSSNQLTSLDLSANTALIQLVCYGNQLTSLDVSTNTALTGLFCSSNQLIHLNMKNGVTDALTFDATSNSLDCIEVNADDIAYATANWTYANGNIDEGVEFSVVCVPEGYTYVPDNNFEQALVDLGYDTAVDDFVLTENISSLTSLDVNGKEISDLTGIEGFTALETLVCFDNQLTSLDVTANTALTSLNCENNELTSLDVSANTALTSLECNTNQLTNLDVSANTSLTILHCYGNQLTGLDVSANTALTTLDCSSNDITSLNVSSNTALDFLDCNTNQLIYLNMKNGATDQLAQFDATNNDLTCIETLDPAWATENWTSVNGNIDEGVEFSVVCVPEGYTYVPDNNFEQALVDLGHDDALDNFVLIENIADLDSLDVSEKEINDLTGIEAFTTLTYLNCSSNSLISLDMSANTALIQLYCNENELTSLDVSNNTALTLLACNENQLTSLDLSANTILTGLYCHVNPLTSLDVNSNTALTHLQCNNNQLTSLDVSNNTALTLLVCNENQLTTLDVSSNTSLADLQCPNNLLTSLDVSVNAALTSLEVHNNHLTYLNMKNGVTDALTTFDATDNSLTCIEVNEEDVDWATENWTYANGNIDQDVSFTVCCMVSEDCLAPQLVFSASAMYLAAVPGSETQFNIVLSNDGDFSLDYTVTVDAIVTGYIWLSTVESGQVLGDSTVSIPVSLDQTDNMSAGTYTGYLYFGTNTGTDPGVIVANTDTVTITLNLMNDDTQLADTTVTIPGGDVDPINFVDDSGQSMGIMVDFANSDGGSVTIQSIGSQPPMDETPVWEDPDGLITDPVFPEKYFEISTDIAGDYWVDIGLDYTMLPGIDNPQSLRLAKRPGYAGASEPWTVIAATSTEINTTDGLVVAKSQTSFSQWAMISNASDNSFIDTQSPVISNFALAPAQPSILEDVTVTADLTDGTGIAAATLYYMAGGGSGYTSVDMSGSGSSYSGTIPGSAVSMAGLFYYIVAQDPLGLSTTSDTLSSPVQFIAGSLSTSTAAGSAYPNGLAMDAWRLISIPAVLDETGVGLVIGDELGAQDNNTWRMFEYDKTTSSYKANPVDFTMDESYWLYQRVEDNLSVATPAGETGNMSGTTLTITSGWNFIGSPYPFPVSLSLDQVQFYGPITYGLVGEEWSSVVTELDPWNGYAVYNRTASDKTIVLDPGSAGAGLAARSLAKEEGWLMTLQVSAEEYQDRFNTIGALSSAHDERDWHDNPEITAPGKSVSLSFKIPDEEGTHGVTSDVRALDGQLKVWDAKIRTQDLEGAVNLSWIIEQELHASKSVQLVDLSSRTVMDMLGQDYLNLGTVDSRYDHQIRIVAGEPEQVALAVDEILATIPEELSLDGNYPNPFNPVTTIRFGLPEPRNVRVTVVNLLGQEVTELVNGWRDIGRHEVVWQGVDRSGKAVASGMYFTVMSDGNKIIVQKMLLLK